MAPRGDCVPKRDSWGGGGGYDFAAAMVEVARANYPAGPFRQAGAEALPHPEGGFDLAVNAF